VQEHQDRASLLSEFSKIPANLWKEEKDMYPDIRNAMQSSLYYTKTGIFVVDTHKSRDFPPDISISDYEDDRVPYCLWYFIELKMPSNALLTAENCGQVLDYFHKAHAKQPHRRDFIAILSNFVSAWVFSIRYDGRDATVTKRSAPTLADAIIHADVQSRQQYTTKIPSLDKRLSSEFTVLAVGRLHFLLQVPVPVFGSAKTTPTPAKLPPTSNVQTRHQSKGSANESAWRSPCRHRGKKSFALKIVNRETTVAKEIKILRKIRDAECIHLPELVWEPGTSKELGIVPIGDPIDFRQVASVSRKIVKGLMDGLQWLHTQGIIHRDIRPSNLVLDHMNNVVIIDYETAVECDGTLVEYLGGLICWPKQLIRGKLTTYEPKPADDLFASILVVLHLLFPSRFDAFRASSIKPPRAGEKPTSETKQLLDLWDNIEQSTIWKPFVVAAEDKNYQKLKEMGDVFCHV
jgi:hypothetical protein